MRNPFTRDHLLSLVSAPLIWALHFLSCYVLVSLSCAFGFGGVGIGIGIVTLAALALIGAIGLANYRTWKQSRSVIRHTAVPDAQVRAFFSLNAMMLCALSAVALIWVAVPAAMLPPCTA